MARPRLLPSAFALLLLSISYRPALPHTLVLDGAAQPELPTLRVGDSIIFKQVDGYDLYMFRSKRASDLCLLARASQLLLRSSRGNPSSHFTWHPSSPGQYYFSYKNSSLAICEASMRVQVTVVPASAHSPTPSGPSPLPAPPPTPGNDAGDFFPSLPHARSAATSPKPSPGGSHALPGDGRVPSSAAAPSAPFAGSGGGGLPFISSNPALPLPTGEADSATTSRPLPVTGGGGHPGGGTGLGIQMAAWVSLAVGFALWGI
ncbi:hypothetical protein Taro_017715 [Colocasia esculenta]|uniref:Uncharacterized protein n=1 Tax=Colocasia esculenta TaxID=4460 RepID=A0A843UU25_COLES|nr:hypothetical protein [Colocasia esculenta]